MSKKVIRKDKTCLNCRHVVENRFCPNCGQENADTRKTFHHLFIHFFEDLTHYENAFWRTIKNLVFKPASLTKEYLSGKRLSYLAPVRLYIFISFLVFFIISIFPDKEINFHNSKDEKAKSENKQDTIAEIGIIKITQKNNYYNYDSIKAAEEKKIPFTKEEIEINKLIKVSKISQSTKDTLLSLINKSHKEKWEYKSDFMNINGVTTLKQLDSLKKFGKGEDEIGDTEYWIGKKFLEVKKRNTRDEVIEKGKDSAAHNFPKVLLIYMPIFAFFLWLFHSKKRWYYFDHGIFTLHYFSFLLLVYFIVFIVERSLNMFVDNSLTKFLENSIRFIGFGWMFYYFFPAHHRFYGETRWISFFKSIILFFINMIIIVIILLLFFVYTMINIH